MEGGREGGRGFDNYIALHYTGWGMQEAWDIVMRAPKNIHTHCMYVVFALAKIPAMKKARRVHWDFNSLPHCPSNLAYLRSLFPTSLIDQGIGNLLKNRINMWMFEVFGTFLHFFLRRYFVRIRGKGTEDFQLLYSEWLEPSQWPPAAKARVKWDFPLH